MMRNLVSKLNLFFTLFVGILSYSQKSAPPPPPPSGPGPGAITQPIDMYLLWLGVLAIAMIIYFAKIKIKKIA